MKRNRYPELRCDRGVVCVCRSNLKRNERSRKRVKRVYKFSFCVLYSLILIAGLCKVNYVRDSAYEKAIEYIKKDNYKLATLSFEELQVMNYKSFPTDVVNGKDFDKYYKNSAVLYAYTQAVREYRSKSSHHVVDKWLSVMPEDYEGELSEEIDAFRRTFESEYKSERKNI